ncbi:MAG: hypothetical protein HYX53_02115, partial [Chloroflexi bacterium]|nr:hypothetical protein [Chloroflexota bacterium]
MRGFGLLALVVTAVFGALGVFGQMSTEASAQPTISSDQADYPPGSHVYLSGMNWAANETVNIVIDDDAGDSWINTGTVSASDTGTVAYDFYLPNWFIANYTVTATGPISGTATTTFTDLSIGTYDQCSNDTGTGYPTGDTGCRWINGNLQSNNSRYIEGDATVQRLWLTGFAPGTPHSVTFKYGTTKGGKHAYDYLTKWDFSEGWISDADRCQGIDGCTSLADVQSADIAHDPNLPAAWEPAGRKFVMRGGTFGSITTPALVSGDYTGDSETTITVTFTVASSGAMCPTSGNDAGTCSVALWFGAHIARSDLWTLYDGTTGAASVSGSPYHVALDEIDDASVGQRDNQMQANTIVPNGSITIVKNAIPDSAQDFNFNLTNGGLVNNNFSLDDDADATLPNSQTFPVPPGTYTASEIFPLPAGWSLTNLVCVESKTANSTVNVATGVASLTLDAASGNDTTSESITCTFTDELGPKLHLRKVVVNDNGGTATVADFTLTANGTGSNDLSGTSPVDSGPGLLADTWALSETSPAGYSASAWVCVGGTQNGSNITVANGGEATCTITNNDVAPKLHLRKVVVNDNGGTATAADFTLTADG